MTTKYIDIFITTIIVATYITLGAIFSIATESNAMDKSENTTLSNVVSDTSITASIKKAYLANKKISSLNIHVKTTNGKVAIEGTVPNEEIKNEVENIAKKTEGVEEINSTLVVADKSKSIKEAISDATITAAIKAKYLSDMDINSFNIHVQTANGKVTIKGSVPNQASRDKVEAIAWDTDGVKDVISKLVIVNKGKSIKIAASDASITSLIKDKFQADSDVKPLSISVETINGKVTLKGNVPTENMKNHVEEIVWDTDGVNEVTSKLEVRNF